VGIVGHHAGVADRDAAADARDFHRVTLSAPLVNLVAVPVTGIVVPLGFLTLGCELILPALGRLLAVPLTWVTMLLVHVVQWFAHFSGWSYRIPGPPPWLVVVFLSAGVLLAVTARIPKPWSGWTFRCAAGVLAVSALTIATSPFAPRWLDGKLELTVLDVGQGDSLLIVSPHGKTLLIDGGGSFGGFTGREERNGIDPGEDAVSPYLWSRYQRLDVVALTHAHQDHIGGLTAILENFRVRTLWIGREVESPALANLEKVARERRILIVHEIRGNVASWDGIEAQFLWPEIAPGEVGPAPKNNDSLVLRLKYGERTLLMPGDAEKQAESTMLGENSETALRADVLKVGHQGSKNSTMPDFLAAVHPRIAVISAGEDNNPYGHPNTELIERLETAGVRILRTDRDGAVHVLTDGKQLEVSCFVACPDTFASTVPARAQTARSREVTRATEKNQ
jgi:competence protein ComEC